MTVPYIFANAVGLVPASQLDVNFAYVSNNVSTADTVIANAQPTITSVGILTSLSTSGNIRGGNLLTAGLISATANITGGNVATAGLISATGNVTVGGNLTATGGIRKSARVLSATTTLTVADAGGFIQFNSGPYTVTLPNPTQAANAGIGYRFWQNTASNITLSTPAGAFYGPSGSAISTQVLAQATTQYWDVWSDGFNWAVFGIKIA